MPRRMTSSEIADDLAARIESGEYPPDSRLPSYTQVAELYSVSVATAQRAMLVLRVRGLTYTQPGVGVFVADRAH